MDAKNTIDEVVARNLRRLRDSRKPRKWSRTQLAAEFNKHAPLGSRQWNEWRVVDLEGRRSGKGPSPISWSELVTLCVVFDVLLWDLVLPGTDREVVLSRDSLSADGWQGTRTNFVDSGELGEIISGIPGEYVANPEKMEAFKKTYNKENISVAQVLEQQRDLQGLIGQLVDQTTKVGPALDASDRPDEGDGSDDP